MATGKNYQLMIKKLKKQLTTARRKEKAARIKLKTTLSKMKKMGKTHERKVGNHKKTVKAKVVASETSIYMKLANLLRGIAKTPKTSKVKIAKKINSPKKAKTSKKVARSLSKSSKKKIT